MSIMTVPVAVALAILTAGCSTMPASRGYVEVQGERVARLEGKVEGLATRVTAVENKASDHAIRLTGAKATAEEALRIARAAQGAADKNAAALTELGKGVRGTRADLDAFRNSSRRQGHVFFRSGVVVSKNHHDFVADPVLFVSGSAALSPRDNQRLEALGKKIAGGLPMPLFLVYSNTTHIKVGGKWKNQAELDSARYNSVGAALSRGGADITKMSGKLMGATDGLPEGAGAVYPVWDSAPPAPAVSPTVPPAPLPSPPKPTI